MWPCPKRAKCCATASPTGAAAVIDWDTSELIGRPVVLLVEDKSLTGGLVVDEIIAY